ncbi:MAG: radical SAM protein [Candidatus Omnitrophica bacterium]|nr:radical SAM protein [Candidatus Omnitrophota bacterium]MDD5591912.1 radical SAM protein [Candidatus Omnitrophota bacterium]
MNITLIYPLLSKSRSRVDENKQYWPPLGLAYIASVLIKNGHAVQILDRDLILRKNKFDFSLCDRVTLDLIENFGTHIVGFSATTPNVSDVDSFSREIKRKNPGIIIVIGGPHCAGEPVTTLRMCPGIDMLVRGEGEMAMLDIANSIPTDSIANLTYKKPDGSIESTYDRPLIESLDSLPFPARDLLDMRYYTRPSRFISRNLSLRTTHIFTARGCPYNCHYCAGPLIGQHKVRYHSPQRVVAEIEELIGKYFIEAVYFAEDMFLSSKKRVEEMAALFMERDIHKKIVWMAQISTGVATPELLVLMKNAGCVHVEYGFESGSQRVLDLMNKKASVERNKEVAIFTKKSGLRFQGNFIVGYPGETEEDFNKTLSFIKQTRPNNVSLNLFMPLPGTQIYKKLKDEGRLLSNWDDIGNPETPCFNYAYMSPYRFEKLYFNAKLKIILPINLKHFLRDNICHPVRLFYILATQFKSVLTRAVKAMIKLQKIKKMGNA